MESKSAIIMLSLYLAHVRGNKLSITQLHRKADVSYSRCLILLKVLESQSFVSSNMSGRERLFGLEEKGIEAGKCIYKLLELEGTKPQEVGDVWMKRYVS